MAKNKILSLIFVLTSFINCNSFVKPFDKLLNGRSAAQAFEQDVLKSNKPVIIKFYLNGCPPCNRMKPIFETLAKDFLGKVDCFEIEANAFGKLSDSFGIRTAPTFIYLVNGKEVARVRGAVSLSELKSKINPYLK